MIKINVNQTEVEIDARGEQQVCVAEFGAVVASFAEKDDDFVHAAFIGILSAIDTKKAIDIFDKMVVNHSLVQMLQKEQPEDYDKLLKQAHEAIERSERLKKIDEKETFIDTMKQLRNIFKGEK